jgi:hypothetical protein
LSEKEPTLDTYFFDRVRPIVEQALRAGNHGNWPIITLNLDVKTERIFAGSAVTARNNGKPA